MKKIIYIALVTVALFSCDLEEDPVTSTGKTAIFNSESGLSMYINSLYGTASLYGYRSDLDSHLACYAGVDRYFTDNYGPDNVNSWYYSTPRACNYFLENNTSSDVSESIRNNYNGIARYFRAVWYADMIQKYNDVPLIDHVLEPDETEELYGTRTPRTEVADFVYSDFEYAYNNITTRKDPYASIITKDVVLFQWAKFCLYEASWRKYHPTLLGLSSTATTWFQRAQTIAELLINTGDYSLYTDGTAQAYHNMFLASDPTKISSEVLYAWTYGASINLYHATTRCMNSPSYLGGATCPIRYIINMYLNEDGTRFTDNPDYKTMTFQEETKNRDPRMAMNYRTPGYTRISITGAKVRTNPDWSLAYNGYCLRKFASDYTKYDTESTETTCYITMRYAELLLIWAEAKAELGTITDADWAKSVGAIRARAGIKGGINQKPTVADPYLKTLFSTTTDPTLLEIRRERFVELDSEGSHTWSDILRWAEGQMLNLPQEGVYIKEFNTYLDMDEDGNPDLFLYTSADKKPAKAVSGVVYRQVDINPSDGWNCITGVMDDGHTIRYNVTSAPRVFNERCYLSPIATTAITLNPNLKQNPGW